MLTIVVPGGEYFDESSGALTTIASQKLQLEHSLISMSKWESKWEVPFLGKQEHTPEQMLDYVRCMTVTQNVDPLVYMSLSDDNIRDVNSYINKKMTATWFSEPDKPSSNREIVTSEIVYYWMITLNIPVEFQKWHLNRLLTLIKVCSIKNSPKKKMGARALAQRNSALNAQRLRGRR